MSMQMQQNQQAAMQGHAMGVNAHHMAMGIGPVM
jgi:hypothetical protein